MNTSLEKLLPGFIVALSDLLAGPAGRPLNVVLVFIVHGLERGSSLPVRCAFNWISC